MNILVIGSGGVGAAFARIAQRRDFFDRIILADVDVGRASAVVEARGEPDRFDAAYADASDEASLAALIRALRADAVLTAVDPRYNMTILHACCRSRPPSLDMAATLSEPHPTNP